MSRTMLINLLATAPLLLGCGSDPTMPVPTGTYSAEVSGAVTRDASGTATMVHGHSGYGKPTLTLVLGAPGAKDRITLAIASEDAPRTGEHEITAHGTEPVEGKWMVSYDFVANDGKQGRFASVEGVLHVTTSTADRLVGTFELDAEGVIQGSTVPVEIVIEGSFDIDLNP